MSRKEANFSPTILADEGDSFFKIWSMLEFTLMVIGVGWKEEQRREVKREKGKVEIEVE